MKKYALIVAGGKGLRMGAEIPKQFLLLHGKPVLMHTIEAFATITDIRIVLVLPQSQMSYWQELNKEYSFSIPHTLVAGGDTRFQSVKNGLSAISDGMVAIHDGVRPVISHELLNNAYDTCQLKGNAVLAVRLKDSIREVDLLGNKNVNRNNYYLIQTPQVFQSSEIIAAYQQAEHDNFTDDASVLESVGAKIHLVEGSYSNIKITTPEDLAMVEFLLKMKSN
jgi:2-C-methyl-D-erythritol 4-phosphate cytidylyltransferase